MKRFTTREIARYGGLVMLALIIVRSWDSIVAFAGIVLSAIVPLVLGAAMAYVVRIPTNFIERHMFPNNHAKVADALRQPLSLLIAVVLMLVGLVLASSVFIPAFMETISMAQTHSTAFIRTLLQLPLPQPIHDALRDFLAGDLVKSLTNLDVMGFVNSAMGGTVGTIGTQLFGVVNTIMTCFFGILFSVILLTDNTDLKYRVRDVLNIYVGKKRMDSIRMVMRVADTSFHNFIVRQCLEAAILGTIGTVALLATGYEYALGVGVFMALCALVPIVGYPVGLICCALMVVMSNPWMALLYVLVVAPTQMFEATFVLPHIGDPRTVLPPVLTTVGVTIGGGVGGFVGMLVAIPTAATIRQLIVIDANRRREKRELAGQAGADHDAQETNLLEESEVSLDSSE